MKSIFAALLVILPLAACTGGPSSVTPPRETGRAIVNIGTTYLVAKYLEANPERAPAIATATAAIMSATSVDGMSVSIAELREVAREAINYDSLSPADQLALTQLADLLQADLLRVTEAQVGAGAILPPELRVRVYELAFMLNVAATGVQEYEETQ